MKSHPIPFLVFFVFGLCSSAIVAQPAPASMATPSWVTMMEDPLVNYFDALNAYENYWKTHARPPGEEEEMEQSLGNTKKSVDVEKDREEKVKKKKLKGASLEEVEYLKYQTKRFENWAREVKPWVQDNGHILSDEERTAIWQKQQEEIRQQEKK
jgi:hypothetical protein